MADRLAFYDIAYIFPTRYLKCNNFWAQMIAFTGKSFLKVFFYKQILNFSGKFKNRNLKKKLFRKI